MGNSVLAHFCLVHPSVLVFVSWSEQEDTWNHFQVVEVMNVGEEFVGQFVKQGLATKPQDAPKVFKSVASDLKEKIEKKVFHMPRNQVFPREVLNAEKGWEEKYYKIKYRCDPTTDTATLTELRRNVAIEFLRGVVWVWKYYTLTDTPSWSWFYPHHFGPLFADFDLVQPSDLQGLIEFSYDAPFAPFDQLFAVLPSKSLTALPKVYQDLSEDKELKEYFPKRFEIDLNGHELIHSFKAVPLLPFMDQNLLMKHTRKAAKSLTPDEKKRNSFGHTVAFFRKRHKPLNKMLETTEFKKSTLGPNDSPSPPDKSLFVNHIKYNIAGFLYNLSENHPMRSIVPKRKQKVESPFGDQMLFPSFKNDTFSAIYILPQTPEKKKKYGILPGFDFDKTPKLASSWFGNDLRTPESMYRDLIQPVTKKPEKPQAVVIKEDDTSESSEEMHDEMESAVKEVEAESKEAQNELVNEDNDEMKITTEDILERVMQKQDAKQQKGGRRRKFKKAHGNHKIALNKEHPLARSGETPARFAFCEKTQTFPRPVFEKQAEYESKQNVIAEKKRIQKQQKGAKRRRTKDEQLEFKVRHREKSGGSGSRRRSNLSASLRHRSRGFSSLSRKPMTIMVVDLNDFCKMCLETDYDSLQRLYAEYVNTLAAIMKQSNGLMHSFSGGIFVCSWGAIGQRHFEMAKKASNAALQVVQFTRSNPSLSVRVRIGISSGSCLVGEMGGEDVRALQVIGAPMSIAFGLTKLCKKYACSIMCDYATYKNVNFDFDLKQQDVLVFADMSTTASMNGAVFQLVANKGVVESEWMYSMQDSERKDIFSTFNKAWKHAQSGEYNEASSLLEEFKSKMALHQQKEGGAQSAAALQHNVLEDIVDRGLKDRSFRYRAFCRNWKIESNVEV
eukprot:CAMPEP_0117439484 /NCGR_PEP_ID=MMETSP0759-20121206/2588_1 /TAXON_ID=63605 /ORGANISM="Percolomonas cosmopolitus, Strain WS" /LENGTH=896 /DNA_ID=CAMNT_0005231199 /DNA_START=5566 /DNA_END=8257 /DNA_ORIENTATION=-